MPDLGRPTRARSGQYGDTPNRIPFGVRSEVAVNPKVSSRATWTWILWRHGGPESVRRQISAFRDVRQLRVPTSATPVLMPDLGHIQAERPL